MKGVEGGQDVYIVAADYFNEIRAQARKGLGKLALRCLTRGDQYGEGKTKTEEGQGSVIVAQSAETGGDHEARDIRENRTGGESKGTVCCPG